MSQTRERGREGRRAAGIGLGIAGAVDEGDVIDRSPRAVGSLERRRGLDDAGERNQRQALELAADPVERKERESPGPVDRLGIWPGIAQAAGAC